MQIEIDLDAILERLKAELGPLEGVSPFHKMLHINIQDGADSVFPQDKFDVYVRGGDICNPRFHVASDGWDVAFFIKNGEVHNICKRGADMGVLNKMREDAVKWLEQPYVFQPSMTNRENALLQWEKYHH